MAGVLRAEDLHGGLGLGQRGDEVGHRGLPVGRVVSRAERCALADAGVDDDPVDGPEVVAERAEDLEDLLVVGDVEGADLHPAAGVGVEELARSSSSRSVRRAQSARS